MKLYSFFMLIVTFSLYAMENLDEDVEDISWRFNLNAMQDEHIVDFALVKPDTLAYVVHSHHPDCVNDFGIMTNNHLFPINWIRIKGPVSAVKITPAGNLLYGVENGQIGFYITLTDYGKIFTKKVDSQIIALQNNLIIKNTNKKLCKAIAALGANGNLLCIHDDNNFRKLNLFELLTPEQKNYRKEITVADIKPYSTDYELLPFIAYAVRYGQNSENSKNAFVYNPILNKIITFEQTGKVSDIHFLPNHNLCVTSDEKLITLFDVFKAEKLYMIQIPEQGITCLSRIFHNIFTSEETVKIVSCISSLCGKYIATIDDSCRLSIWDSDIGARIYNKKLDICPCDAVKSKMAFSYDGKSIYMCNKRDQKIYNIKDFTYGELSDKERGNAIKMFIRSQHASKNSSILHVLKNRELGLKKIKKMNNNKENKVIHV